MANNVVTSGRNDTAVVSPSTVRPAAPANTMGNGEPGMKEVAIPPIDRSKGKLPTTGMAMLAPMLRHWSSLKPSHMANYVVSCSPHPGKPLHMVNHVVSGSLHPRKPLGNQEAAPELGNKRAKSDPPPTAAKAVAPPPPHRAPTVAASLPPKPVRGETSRPAPDFHQGDCGATEPAWVPAELLPRLGLPADLPLHFMKEKPLQVSDVSPVQARLLIRRKIGGYRRLQALLSVGELWRCGGLDGASNYRTRTPARRLQGGARASPIKHAGVPVLIHERGAGREREPSELMLNLYHTTLTMVVSGHRYNEFIASSGFRSQDRIEIWVFRRPRDLRLCLVIAKRDDYRIPA
ncbi:hypothetical protein ACP4OV_008320 [Aristida adscensionis]